MRRFILCTFLVVSFLKGPQPLLYSGDSESINWFISGNWLKDFDFIVIEVKLSLPESGLCILYIQIK